MVGSTAREQSARLQIFYSDHTTNAMEIGNISISKIDHFEEISESPAFHCKVETVDRTDYILRLLSKTTAKRWEHYVINRLFHRLDDPEIEFVCQQCIRKSDGKIYLADLYFPQFGLYLEIDEAHHESDRARIDDARRRVDIAEASGLTEKRIRTSGVPLERVNADIEEFLGLLRRLKSDISSFPAWIYEERFRPDAHIASGSIEIGPNSVFRYQSDALSCFGYDKGHFQRGAWNIPAEFCEEIGLTGACMVWFPRLHDQENWNNSLSDDGMTITEIAKNSDNAYTDTWDHRIAMARSRDFLNRTLYRFVGVFEPVSGQKGGKEKRFQRIASSVRTVSKST